MWDQADTSEKRRLIQNLLTNAGGTPLTVDDVVRLFIQWIDFYHEAHFAVIKSIHGSPGCTRGDMWDDIHGAEVREDSAEADLFRLLVRDLSTGGVIRQTPRDNGLRRVREKSSGPQTEGLRYQIDEICV